MIIVRRTIFISVLFILLAGSLYAGDIATFVDLGFSEDSKNYMFGQYGINEKSAAYAEIFTVDVKSNRFVSGGVLKKEYDLPIQAGQEGLGALLTLLKEGEAVAGKYDIHHLRTGRLVYILLNGEEPKETVQFRDFQTGKRITITLKQSVFGEGKEISSSFHCEVEIEGPSGTKKYTVGLPKYKREGVTGYLLRKVYVSPDDNALIFVVEKNMLNHDGYDIRYMVETLSFS